MELTLFNKDALCVFAFEPVWAIVIGESILIASWDLPVRFLRDFSASRTKSLPPKSWSFSGGGEEGEEVCLMAVSISCFPLLLSTGSISWRNIMEIELCMIPAIFWSNWSISSCDRKGELVLEDIAFWLWKEERQNRSMHEAVLLYWKWAGFNFNLRF